MLRVRHAPERSPAQRNMAKPPTESRTGSTPARRSPELKNWVVGAVALGLVVWAGNWIYHRHTHVVVDDARIDGEVVTVSSRVSGWIVDLPVIEGDEVKKGQPLVRIDDRDSRLKREVLLARLGAIENQMAVVRAQSGQVDEETLGRFQAETNRLMAAEAEVAALRVGDRPWSYLHIPPWLAAFVVNFAVANGLDIRGHALVWSKDEYTPDWVEAITDPNELGPVLKKAVAMVKAGEPVLIDVITQPR